MLQTFTIIYDRAFLLSNSLRLLIDDVSLHSEVDFFVSLTVTVEINRTNLQYLPIVWILIKYLAQSIDERWQSHTIVELIYLK